MLGTHTIRQQHAKKLKIIHDSIVIGVSGSVGLGQRLTGVVDTMFRENRLFSQPVQQGQRAAPMYRPDQFMASLRGNFWSILQPEFQIAREASQVFPQQITGQSASAMTVMAAHIPNQPGPSLFSFDQQAAPEEASPELPFVAIGSGQIIADPFLAFIRRLFWEPNKAPTLAQGVLAVYWTLHHAIETNAGGVAKPIQVVEIKRVGASWKAKEHSLDEGQEHLNHIDDIERRLTGFAKGEGTTTTAPPDLPPPT